MGPSWRSPGRRGSARPGSCRRSDSAPRPRALEVLRACGAEFERGLAFAGAAQLFQAPLRAASANERSRLLAGAAQLGGELLGFGTREPREVTADSSFAAFHGLYWLCANLAARSPLVMLIDDAHWLDAQSLGWIEYLARRLEGLAVLIIVAARPDEAAGQHLARTAIEIGGQIVELQPLSEDAVRSLFESALQQPTQPAFAVAFQESTGGNPFLVHELLRTIRDEGIAPDGDGALAIRTLANDRIARAVLLRLHRLSPGSVALARAISILGRSGSLSVAARLAQLDDATAAEALEALTAAEVLARGTELRFRHPVVHASIYDDIPAPARGHAPPPGGATARRDGRSACRDRQPADRGRAARGPVDRVGAESSSGRRRCAGSAEHGDDIARTRARRAAWRRGPRAAVGARACCACRARHPQGDRGADASPRQRGLDRSRPSRARARARAASRRPSPGRYRPVERGARERRGRGARAASVARSRVRVVCGSRPRRHQSQPAVRGAQGSRRRGTGRSSGGVLGGRYGTGGSRAGASRARGRCARARARRRVRVVPRAVDARSGRSPRRRRRCRRAGARPQPRDRVTSRLRASVMAPG